MIKILRYCLGDLSAAQVARLKKMTLPGASLMRDTLYLWSGRYSEIEVAIAWKDGEEIGWGMLRPWSGAPPVKKLAMFFVQPPFRRNGIGKRLFKKLNDSETAVKPWDERSLGFFKALKCEEMVW